MSKRPPLMEIRDVVFAYRRHQLVLDRARAIVQPGLLHALIGPNAAGKSTLIKLMLGRLRPRSGRVLFEGRRLRRLSVRRRAALISYVPQRASTGFAFSVREVVAMGRYALPPRPEAIQRAMLACELGPLADRPYAQLSVGQQQRVLLARAMAQAAGQGRLMLLDEPTSAMDLAHAHRTMEQLRWLAGRGLAVVAVLQDLNVAARYADRIWLMDGGRLVADAPWADVLRPPILEPVYGVSVRSYRVRDGAEPEAAARPLFDVRLPQPYRGE